ncbi:putative bifunctional diguanylate cyclase/phosphodiesterase [Kineococcus terrestris]|uniref:putative bifunctional diguanylate cyclase/phosphodiesterase n=1 Tax=Kineococcus terrestris TaxID=2044856 RepID=UPI0034DAEA42
MNGARSAAEGAAVAAGLQQGLQLVELLAALAHAGGPERMAQRAVQWIAEQLDCEVAAVVEGDRVLAALGVVAGPAGEAVVTALGVDPAAPARLAGMSDVDVASAPVPTEAAGPDTAPGTARLVVARAEEPLDAAERLLLLGTGRLLGQAVQAARALLREREARRRGEELALEREELLRTLRERELVLSTLLTLQRAVSHRWALEELLDLLCDGAQTVLGGDAVAVVLENPLRAAAGRPDERPQERLEVRAVRRGDGAPDCPDVLEHAARAVEAGSEVSGEHGGCRWRAAPVRAQGRPVGALLLLDGPGTAEPATRHLLTTFTEQASVALNDVYTERSLQESYYDQLTRLPNRALFLDRLSAALAAHERDGGALALLYLDLDGFKAVNDRYGHEAGDAVLRACADRVRDCLRQDDTAARLGGDEFAVVLRGADLAAAQQVAERLVARLRQPVEHEGHALSVGCSVGVAAPGHEGTVGATLLRDADTAMYEAKHGTCRPAEPGRARVEVFRRSLHEARADRLELEADLEGAAARGELVLHHQPVVRLADGRTTGVEALVRWQHPRRGLLGPDRFIGAAERSGAIAEVGRWVLATACAQAAAWRAGPAGHPDLTVAVNLSVAQLAPGLVEEVRAVLADTGLPATALVLEITETVFVQEGDTAREVLAALRALGVRIAVDDFGTGYSSLSYLRRLPVDVLKIDRSFVRAMGRDEDTAVVRTVIGLAQALGLETVAEGVESAEEGALLRRLGCDQAQGYHWSRPVPAADLPAALSPPVPAAVPAG